MTGKKEKQKCPPHKYRRRNLTRKKDKDPYYVFACLECTHHIQAALAVGKVARCFFCNEEFVITAKHLEFAKIKCDGCVKHSEKKQEMKSAIDDLVDSIFKGE